MRSPIDPSATRANGWLRCGVDCKGHYPTKLTGNMSDEPQKPKLRRWRWFVVAFVLLFVVAGWWNWPRGDARFVGKWRVTQQSVNRGFVTFSSNGSMTSTSFTWSPRFWRYTGAQIELHGLLRPLPNRLAAWIKSVGSRITGNRALFSTKIEYLDILVLTDTRIEFQNLARDIGGDRFVLTRIPE